MSEVNCWTQVGFVKSAHGLKGEIYIQLHAKVADWDLNLAHYALGSTQSQSPEAMSIVAMTPHKQGFIVKTHEIQNRDQAEVQVGYKFFVDSKSLTSAAGERVYLKELLTFQVMNDGNSIGCVTGFQHNGAQDLLVVSHLEKSALVPLVDPFIEKIDFEKKMILMHLPDGLLELADANVAKN